MQPGRLKKVQGIGWYLEEKNLAQVSTNLLDFEVTALHTVYEEARREAQVGKACIPHPSDTWGPRGADLSLCLTGAESPSGGLTAGGPGASEGLTGCRSLLL